MDNRIPKYLEKLSKPNNYNGVKDLDKHIEHYIPFSTTTTEERDKLFVLTLKGSVMTWFITLPYSSIIYTKKLCDKGTSQLTTHK